MEHLDTLLLQLPERHRTALQWFVECTGEEHPWPRPLHGPAGETLLVSKAKGIYKPRWSQYALSVRQSLKSPYPDREPVSRPDGTWLLAYFQENPDPSARDDEYTNRALLRCWRDRVPVGVLYQSRRKPTIRYQALGVALVAGWDGGYFFLEGFAHDGIAHRRGPAGEIELLMTRGERMQAEADVFDPANAIDGRGRIIAHIAHRRGQPEFRRKLLEVYGGCCAISGCNVVEALEAAHILPYKGDATNHISNGLLLRADLHTLFDLGLVTVDSTVWVALLSPNLLETSYGQFARKPIRLPLDVEAWPSLEALRFHRAWCGL